MIILDYRDTRPLYEQIVDKFQTLILKGVLEPNAKMPSVRSLAVELSINPNTIQRAYSELERTGFIYTVKGRGNFVSYDESLKQVRREEIFQRLDALVEEAQELGMTKEELSGRILSGGTSDVRISDAGISDGRMGGTSDVRTPDGRMGGTSDAGTPDGRMGGISDARTSGGRKGQMGEDL